MVSCCQCEDIATQFGAKTARRELTRFRRRGPIRSTSLLIDDLRSTDLRDALLLDVGGGIGAIHHLLIGSAANEAVHVDASSDYIDAARQEATRRGHADRVRFVQGDFTRVATTLPPADIVTLDRVICCYPDMAALVSAAADKARAVLGAVYPRDAWWMRSAVKVINLVMRARRSTFRVFVHSPDAIDAVLRRHGLERRTRRRTAAWEIVTYRRG